MAATWPVEEFRDYVRSLMNEAGIPDYAELSRLSGVNQTQLSNWRRGIAQPSKDNLRRLAPVLGVSPVKLYIAAGVNTVHELDLDEGPDLRVTPRELLDLIDLYGAAESDDQRAVIRRMTAIHVAGLRAELGIPAGGNNVRPSGRRRAG